MTTITLSTFDKATATANGFTDIQNKKEDRMKNMGKIICFFVSMSLASVACATGNFSVAQAPSDANASKNRLYKIVKGKQYQMCKDYLNNLNRVAPEKGLNCGVEQWFDDEAKSKGFRQVDWEEINPYDHVQLLRDYFMHRFRDNAEDYQKQKEDYFYNNLMKRENLKLFKAKFNVNNRGDREYVFRFYPWGCREEKGNTPILFLGTEDVSFDHSSVRSATGEVFVHQGLSYLTVNYPSAHTIIEPSGKINDTKEICTYSIKEDS